MNSERRQFIKRFGITLLGMPLASNLVFSSSIGDFNQSNSMTQLTSQLKKVGYHILYNKSYMLNANCKAIPICKQHMLWPNEEGLVLQMSDGTSFVLNPKQVKTYKTFIANFKSGLNEQGLKRNTKMVTDVATPKVIIKHHNFKFKNAKGQVIELKPFKKDYLVNIT